MDIKEIAKKAYGALAASNLSGLVHSWHVWLPDIRAHAEKHHILPNDHPINVIMADKVAQLAGIATNAPMGAYEAVERLANGEP
jgi:CHAD domain-containing protein